uniref:Ribulose-1,5-bisphosphate carboxylase/oxygenase large subunit n=1 Tax=Romanomermis culicivorax TaxID=13658 RepID=A0A915I0U7_ROMCU
MEQNTKVSITEQQTPAEKGQCASYTFYLETVIQPMDKKEGLRAQVPACGLGALEDPLGHPD